MTLTGRFGMVSRNSFRDAVLFSFTIRPTCCIRASRRRCSKYRDTLNKQREHHQKLLSKGKQKRWVEAGNEHGEAE